MTGESRRVGEFPLRGNDYTHHHHSTSARSRGRLARVDEVLREVERAFPELTVIIVRGNRVALSLRGSWD